MWNGLNPFHFAAMTLVQILLEFFSINHGRVEKISFRLPIGLSLFNETEPSEILIKI